MNECKIVQDLMPLYAEDLTSHESREFMEKHLESCEECHAMWQRCLEPMPEPEQINPKAYKKSLRKDAFKMAMKVLLPIVLIPVLVFAIMLACGHDLPVWDSVFIKNTYESKAVEYPAYYAIAVGESEDGLQLITRKQVYQSDETGSGTRGSGGSSSILPWESASVHWSPAGMDVLITAQIKDGGIAYYVWDNELAIDEGGNLYSPEDWYPSPHTNGLAESMIPLCQAHPDFPTGWESVEFTFFRWSDDSERITFVYELDNGTRGFLEYEYKTETITVVD